MATFPVEVSNAKAKVWGTGTLALVRRIAIVALFALVFSEAVCEFAIGLGDPPLYQADSRMEYMLQPSRTYYRFHNRFSVNQYGMRADDFPPRKADPRELRVLVIGDSIVYGGVRIDQSQIDTEILKRNLQQEFSRPVVVGNASAKSWGPPNELAYLERFGALDADVIILELSSHDYADAPTFAPVVGIAAEYPDKKPKLGIEDLLETYILPRYFHMKTVPEGIDRTGIKLAETEEDIAQCREAEHKFFALARQQHAKIALVQHLSRTELDSPYQTGYSANQEVAIRDKVPFVDDADALRAKLRTGQDPFYAGDNLHLNRSGQIALAETLQRAVELALSNKN